MVPGLLLPNLKGVKQTSTTQAATWVGTASSVQSFAALCLQRLPFTSYVTPSYVRQAVAAKPIAIGAWISASVYIPVA
jgi:hypothetical protein